MNKIGQGQSNAGLYFILAVALIFIVYFIGKVFNDVGPIIVLIGTVLILIGIYVAGETNNPTLLIIGGIIFLAGILIWGIGSSIMDFFNKDQVGQTLKHGAETTYNTTTPN
ncbi:hypothetical protein K8R33_01070 [archaeon]|nr:hypothetical protein [archaeon]